MAKRGVFIFITIVLFSANLVYCSVLDDMKQAEGLSNSQQFKQAKAAYLKIAENYPKSEYAQRAADLAALQDVWCILCKSPDCNNLNLADAEKIVTGLREQMQKSSPRWDTMLDINRAYIGMGRVKLEQEKKPADANMYFLKAIEVCEEIKKSGSSDQKMHALWSQSHCYFKLGDFYKSISRSQEVIQQYPQSDLASTAQYYIGLSYIELGTRGLMDKEQAKTAAIEAFTKVKEKYPASQFAGIASQQLDVLKTGRTSCFAVQPSPEQVVFSIDVFVLDANTNKPIADAEISNNYLGNLKADQNGFARISLTQQSNYFYISASKEGYAGMKVEWNEVDVNKIPDTFTFSLEKGISIGGVVHNEAGQPIKGVGISISFFEPSANGKPTWYIKPIQPAAMTDANGCWSLNHIPSDLNGLNLRFSHQSYSNKNVSFSQENPSLKNLKNKTFVQVLENTVKLSGSVCDESGKPIADASILIGNYYNEMDAFKTKSDQQGHFVFESAPQGSVTVTASAPKFAPELRKIAISEDTEPLQFVLLPGNIIKGRVADINDKPLSDVKVSVSSWRSCGTIAFETKTDANGFFAWDSAPADKVSLQYYKEGFMSYCDNTVLPQKESKVVLYKPFIIKGSVVNADTNQPVSEFTITKTLVWSERSAPNWLNNGYYTKEFMDGSFEIKFDQSCFGYVLRAESEGYIPAVSRVFKLEEKAANFDFKLEKGKTSKLCVFTPVGKPAAGAKVYVIEPNQTIYFTNTKPQNLPEAISTDANGCFTMMPHTNRYKLLVFHSDGFADVNNNELPASSKIELKRWGRVEGVVYIGSRPAGGQQVHLGNLQGRMNIEDFRCSFNSTAVTDNNGFFVMEKAMPGKADVAREVQSPNHQMFTLAGSVQVDVTSGQTSTVTIGGGGIPVIGQLVLPESIKETPHWQDAHMSIQSKSSSTKKITDQLEREFKMPRPENFDLMTYSQVMEWYKNWSMSNEGKSYQKLMMQRFMELKSNNKPTFYPAFVEANGTFRSDDVKSGDYTLSVDYYNLDSYGQPDYKKPLAGIKTEFTVPQITEQNKDMTLDLSQIVLEPTKDLQQGDTCPDFGMEDFDGNKISIADYSGRFILINFWRPPVPQIDVDSDAQIQNLKNIHDTFAGDSRFEILGLAMKDFMMNDLNKKFIAEKGMNWKHGTMAASDENSRKLFQLISRYPFAVNILVGPDGRIISIGLKGDELMNSVSDSLGK